MAGALNHARQDSDRCYKASHHPTKHPSLRRCRVLTHRSDLGARLTAQRPRLTPSNHRFALQSANPRLQPVRLAL